MSVSKHTAYNLAGAVIPLILSFVTVPLYLHLVGAERFGVLSIAWLLLGYFGLFDLGLGKATSYRMASLHKGEASDRANVFRTALLINLGIGVIGGLVLWAAGWWFFGSVFKVGADLRAETLAGLPWLAAAVPVATLTGMLTGALQGREKFLETNIVSVISTVLFQLFPIGIAWFYGPNLVGLLAAAVSARIVAIIVLWWRCHAEFTRGQSPRWLREEEKALLSFGGWVTVNGMLWPVLFITDRFLIGSVLGARAVAVYTIPFQLAQRASIVPNAVASALFPRIAASSDTARNDIFDKSVRSVAAALGVPILVGLFLMEPFLTLWVGREMATAAYPIGQIVLVGIWANSLTALYYNFYQAVGRPRTVSFILLAQTVPYLAILWMALQNWGLEGAAWTGAIRAFAILLPMFRERRHSFKTIAVVGGTALGLFAGYFIVSRTQMSITMVIGLTIPVLGAMSALAFWSLWPDFGDKLPRLKPKAG